MFTRLLLSLILLAVTTIAYGQEFTKDYKPNAKFANLCITFHNYVDGLKEFKALLREDPDNVDYNYGAGICYLNLRLEKKFAIEKFEWVIKQDKYNDEVWYDLGRAYLENYEFEKAKNAFVEYKKRVPNSKLLISADEMLKRVEYARESYLNPANIQVTNMGDAVNSEFPEFYAFIPSNESVLIYNSQRKSNYGNFKFYDGYYPSDIYISDYKFGHWRKSKRLSTAVNSNNAEEIVSLTSDGSIMFISRRDIDDNQLIYESKKKGKNYMRVENIFLDDDRFKQIHSIALSPNKKYIVFSATLKDGVGGKDLYLSFKSPNGYWSKAKIIDSTINTIYDEDNPYFSPDGKTFFFASQGHKNMGGYDIFKCTWIDRDSSHFSNLQTIGFPLNTPCDERSISLSQSGRYAYISSFRAGGLGDLDIYRVIFYDVSPTLSVVHGTIYDQDSVKFSDLIAMRNLQIDSLNMPILAKYKEILAKKKDSIAANKVLKTKLPHEKINAQILVIDKSNNQKFGEFTVRNDNGNYSSILPPGEWKIIFKRDGYEDYILDNIIIEERDQRNRDLIYHVKMRKL